MATAVIEKPSTDIVVASKPTEVVLFDSTKFDEFYARLKDEADQVPVDLTTAKGRAVIASFAAKVRSEKADIDRDRLRLTKEWRDLTANVNGAWNVIKERLDGLAVDVRKPLTEWEEAEKARAADCERQIQDIHIAAIIAPEDTAATIRDRGTMVWQIKLDPAHFGDKLAEAEDAKKQAVATLKAALTRLEQEEADKAELEKLRAEKEARDAADRYAAEQEAQRKADEEAKAKAARDAAEAEERRVAAEKAEADRIEQAKAEAAAAAQRAAEEAAQAERDRIKREHDEALAAEKRRADEAEAQRKAEADRIAKEAAAKQAEEKRLADEQAARDANRAHRSRIQTAAKQAIMTCGCDEDTARKVVLAIIAGEIPNVTLRF